MDQQKATKGNRLLAGVIAASLVIGLLIWVATSALRSGKPKTKADAETTPAHGLAKRPPADVRVAVLFQGYDHYRENVPPRNDTSARQRDWEPPPPPLEVIRAALSPAGKAPSEPELLKWFETWDAGFRAGKALSPVELERLRQLLEKSSLTFEPIFKVGAAFQYLEGDQAAAVVHRTALGKAERDYKNLGPDHPTAGMLRVALPQMGFLWRANDHATLERRFALESLVYPPLSQESRKCSHSRAEAQFYQGKYKEAADNIHEVLSRDQQAGDMTESDTYEMGWVAGLFYHAAGRYAEAAPQLAIAASPGKYHSQGALTMLIDCLAETGNTADMKARMQEYNDRYAPDNGARKGQAP